MQSIQFLVFFVSKARENRMFFLAKCEFLRKISKNSSDSEKKRRIGVVLHVFFLHTEEK